MASFKVFRAAAGGTLSLVSEENKWKFADTFIIIIFWL